MSGVRTLSFDAVIVGGGGSGLRAALQLSQSGYKTAVISNRIKPHAPPLVRAPVNSFEFHSCERTPQAGYLTR